MKKYLMISIALLACCVQAEAQKYLNIFQDGIVIKKILASDVESISVTEQEPYMINMWSNGKIIHSFAQEEVDSITVIDEKGGPLSYIGIIGFNDNLHPNNIGLLSNSTVSNYKNFISNLKISDGTILYYAVDSALYVLDKADIKTPLTSINLVTFTDGLDQGSIMKNPNYSSSNSYLDDLRKRIKDTKYNGIKMEAYSIGLRGNDVTDVDLFERNLKNLASSDQNAFEVRNMDELKTRLQEIANKIINVNYRQTISVRIPGADNGTLVRFTFDLNDYDNDANKSNLYIQGTLDLTDYTLRNVTYHGIKARSGSIVQGTKETKDGIFLTFTFRGLRQADGETVLPTKKVKQFNYSPSSTNWQVNSEFKPDNNTQRIVSYSGTLIMLVLDCSSSLGSDFSKMQNYAQEFVNMVANNAMPFTLESPKIFKVEKDDNAFAVNVSWDAVKGADYYQIYRSNSNSYKANYELIADHVTSCSWTDEAPSKDNRYYKVCAVGYGVKSAMSNYLSAGSFSLDNPKNIVCEKTINDDKIVVNVSWDAVKYAEGYQFYKKEGNKYKLFADSIKSTSYIDESPLSGANSYYVKAIGHGMVSGLSDYASVDYSMPSPQNVVSELIVDNNNIAVRVTWSPVTEKFKNADKNVEKYEWESMITDDFDKSIPIKKIRVLNKKSASSSYCCIAFTTSPNGNEGTDRYWISFNTLSIGDNKLHDQGKGISISSCTNVGNNWYEYEFSQPVYFAYYQDNCPRGQVKIVIEKAKSELSDLDLSTGTLWAVVNLAQKYQVYRSNSSNGSYELVADNVTTNSWVDNTASQGNNYYYRIRAVGYGLTSSESKTSGKISLTMPTPQNVKGELVLNGSNIAINVTWDVVKIAEKYQVYRSNSSYGSYELVADNVTTNSWVDNTAMQGNTYYYRIRAVGYELTSSDSNSSEGISLTMPTPQNVTSEMVLNGSKYVINLAWDAVKIAEKYQVYRSKSYSGSYELVADNVTTNSWVDTTPLQGYNYYRIRAVGHEMTSSNSKVSSVDYTLSANLKNVVGALTLSGNNLVINVTWDAVENVSGYHVYRSNTSYGEYKLVAENIKTNSWTDKSPIVGSNYYKIQAVDHGLTSQMSSPSNVVNCSLEKPQNVKSELALSNNKFVINVSWDAVQYAESYIVYRSTSSWSSDFAKIAENVKSNSWIDETPVENYTYYYKIVAVGHGLTSDQSYQTDGVSISLSSPSNVKGELLVNNKKLAINVTWDAVPLAESYTVYRNNDQWYGTFEKVAENINSNSWIDNDPLSGTNYYKVVAVGHGLTSQQSYSSDRVNYSIPAPQNVKSEKTLSDGKVVIALTWDKVKVAESYFAESYIVYRSASYSGEYVKIADNITKESWTDESPMDGNNYYKIAAYGYGVTSSMSSYTSQSK